ncbi:MAG: carboxypeptidase regulatory-like domain-containing protein, partial [Thermodesulfovibrionia bacterium]|nr:carboxypeptidase regulatory-like domain-containing protein [Thermodesulfovibrionia bacterium]
MKDEIENYLPTAANSTYYLKNFSPPSDWKYDYDRPYCPSHSSCPTALIEGTWEEDVPLHWGRYLWHYWDPDESYDTGLYEFIGGSALQRAQEYNLFENAIHYYVNKLDKALSYYLLGRIAHLLMDMSVPAHTLLDAHPPWDPDRYEEVTKDDYMLITSEDPNTDIPNIESLAPYDKYTPSNYDSKLTKLFYNLAQKANDFDTEDYNGRSSEYGYGKFRYARMALHTNKTVSKVEYWKPCWTPFPDYCKIKDMVRYSDYDIIINDCDKHRIYFYERFYKDINNTLNVVKVRYTDGTMQQIFDLDENDLAGLFGWKEPYQCIHQPELQTRAIGYVAALYQLFWEKTHGSITGTIKDENTGSAINGATVKLNVGGIVPYLINQTTTNSTGSFSFSDVEFGFYSLVLYREGYTPKTISNFTVYVDKNNNLGP